MNSFPHCSDRNTVAGFRRFWSRLVRKQQKLLLFGAAGTLENNKRKVNSVLWEPVGQRTRSTWSALIQWNQTLCPRLIIRLLIYTVNRCFIFIGKHNVSSVAAQTFTSLPGRVVSQPLQLIGRVIKWPSGLTAWPLEKRQWWEGKRLSSRTPEGRVWISQGAIAESVMF